MRERPRVNWDHCPQIGSIGYKLLWTSFCMSTYVFSYLGYLLRSGINFEELPNCFTKWLYYFKFPPAMSEDFNFSISSPILIFCFFDDSLVDIKLYLMVGFIWISVTITNVENLFHLLLTICKSILEKYLFKFFAH